MFLYVFHAQTPISYNFIIIKHCITDKKEYTLPNDICCKSIAANKANDKLALGPSGQDKPMILDVNK